ncbi:MAG TPA: hypothetical protein DDZ96_13135 [Porphyromonadaceae bacterium]|jgi:hypothetical protein|nr:hypothetical protein [Porphyromonadaceae bacterium]HBL34739.1 hypothetical protein [Porphyromonadaceae bacterium]HCM21627.1 hypothetical protein [Porphyromonadaceae bacterium]
MIFFSVIIFFLFVEQFIFSQETTGSTNNDKTDSAIDDLGYLTYRNEMRLLKSRTGYEVLNKYFETLEGFSIIQKFKEKSKQIDTYYYEYKKDYSYNRKGY